MDNKTIKKQLVQGFLEAKYEYFYGWFCSQDGTEVLKIRVDLFPDSFRFEIINQDERLDNKSGEIFKSINSVSICKGGQLLINNKKITLYSYSKLNNIFKRVGSLRQRNELILLIYDALEDFAKNYQGFEENVKLENKIVE